MHTPHHPTGISLFLSALLLAATLMSCAKTNQNASTGLTDLSALPKVTDAVSTNASSTVRNIARAVGGSTSAVSSTGTLLKNWASSSWSGKSRAFCEVGRNIRDVFRQASQPGTIQCYMAVMKKYGGFTGTVDDGQYHYAHVSGSRNEDNSESPGKIKVKIVKSGDDISEFEMFMCFNNNTQDGYVHQTISGSSISIEAVDSYSGNYGTWRSRTEGTGAFAMSDTRAVWTSKTITSNSAVTFSWDGNSGSDNQHLELTQYANKVAVTGYRTGAYAGTNHEEKFYAATQFLGANNPTYALGDGTAKALFVWGNSTFNDIQAWEGDSRTKVTPATGGNYYSEVSAATLPSIGTPDTDFKSDETWNCQSATGDFTTINFVGVMAAGGEAEFEACNTDNFNESNWVNCYSEAGE